MSFFLITKKDGAEIYGLDDAVNSFCGLPVSFQHMDALEVVCELAFWILNAELRPPST